MAGDVLRRQKDKKMNLEQLIAFLKANNATPETIAFAEQLKPVTMETVQGFLQSDEQGKKYLQSHVDQAVTKGITTFKEKTMPSLIEEAISVKFPAETADQKELRSVKENLNKLARDLSQKELLNKALQIAHEKKLPVKLVEKFIGEDEATTLANLQLLETEYNNGIKGLVENQFQTQGRDPKNNGTDPGVDDSKLTDDQYFQKRILSEQQKK